jgi:hypothetical protein
MFPYVVPSEPQTGLYSIVQAIGFDSPFGRYFSEHSRSPQTLLAVLEPKFPVGVPEDFVNASACGRKFSICKIEITPIDKIIGIIKKIIRCPNRVITLFEYLGFA